MGKAVGRPCLLTEEIHQRVCEVLKLGNRRDVAARAAGISERTLYRWLEFGEADYEDGTDTLFGQFWQGVKEAEAYAEAQDIQNIELAAKNGNWQASAWRLERRYPTVYGRRDPAQTEVQERQQQFERVVLDAIDSADPETAGRIRQTLYGLEKG